MADEHLATYLNDHLAGSVLAVDLLERLEAADTDMTDSLTALRNDIEADRRELQALMSRLGIVESRSRKVSGWLAEKLTQLKLRVVDDRAGGSLWLLESLEAVALGVDGKLALWRALSAAADVAPELQSADYQRLTRRAEEQRQRIEVLRLEAAKAALAPGQ
jgi:hypothetical protein